MLISDDIKANNEVLTSYGGKLKVVFKIKILFEIIVLSKDLKK